MKPLLTICIVNYNSSNFVLNTLYCLEKTTKHDYKVMIRDNNSKINDFLNLRNNISKYENIELYRVDNFNYTGSLAHAIALNELINKIDTKYGVILDADCTFLHKNWDEILINEINENYPIIGTPGEPGKSQDFPLMYAILFDTNIMKTLNIDFKPKDIAKLKDTGYELHENFLKQRYKGKILEYRNTRNYKSGPFRNVICVEFYLKGHKKIIASHFGRGSSLGKSKYLHTRMRFLYIIPIIGSFLLKVKGKRERKRWINICKNIVKDFK